MIVPCVPLFKDFVVVEGAFTCIVSSNMIIWATILAGVGCSRKEVLTIMEAIISIESLRIVWTPFCWWIFCCFSHSYYYRTAPYWWDFQHPFVKVSLLMYFLKRRKRLFASSKCSLILLLCISIPARRPSVNIVSSGESLSSMFITGLILWELLLLHRLWHSCMQL